MDQQRRLACDDFAADVLASVLVAVGDVLHVIADLQDRAEEEAGRLARARDVSELLEEDEPAEGQRPALDAREAHRNGKAVVDLQARPARAYNARFCPLFADPGMVQ